MINDNTVGVTNNQKYLSSLQAIRERTRKVYELVKSGKSLNWEINEDQLSKVVENLVFIIKRDYASASQSKPTASSIPPHSRWQHFNVGGKDRISSLLNSWQKVDKCDDFECCRRLMDLFVVSVLLDAGAGDKWSFEEDGNHYVRSEGLAVASLHMFNAGLFSDKGKDFPSGVNAKALLNLNLNDLSKGLQVTKDNPLVGTEGRCNLLRSLGKSLLNNADKFGEEGRPGNLLDYLLKAFPNKQIEVSFFWRALMDVFLPVWPAGRTLVDGKPLGDIWKCDILQEGKEYDNLVPFHKLTQWLAYSLMDPINRLLKCSHGIAFKGEETMTGLAEYRNGGLFVDFGVIKLKSQALERGMKNAQEQANSDVTCFEPGDQAVVEWRALTVQLLDVLADLIRKKFQWSSEEMPLPKLLEAGSWKAGREIAAKLRPKTKGPPISIISDGTLF